MLSAREGSRSQRAGRYGPNFPKIGEGRKRGARPLVIVPWSEKSKFSCDKVSLRSERVEKTAKGTSTKRELKRE